FSQNLFSYDHAGALDDDGGSDASRNALRLRMRAERKRQASESTKCQSNAIPDEHALSSMQANFDCASAHLNLASRAVGCPLMTEQGWISKGKVQAHGLNYCHSARERRRSFAKSRRSRRMVGNTGPAGPASDKHQRTGLPQRWRACNA